MQEVDQLLSLAGIRLQLVDEQPRHRRDRVRLLPRCIHDRHAVVGSPWQSLRDALRRLGDALDRGLHVLAGGVLHQCVGNLVLAGVCQFDVADRARQLLHLAGDAFIALAAQTDGPLHILPLAGAAGPCRAHGRQVVSPDVGRAAAIGAVHDQDVRRRQHHAPVLGDEPWIVPLRDLPEEDVRQHRAADLQRLLQLGQAVDHDHGAHHRRDVEHRPPLRLAELLVAHRAVTRPEVDRLLAELPDTAARANRLVVDLHAGLRGVIVEPLRVNRIRKGGACTGQVLRVGDRRDRGGQRGRGEHSGDASNSGDVHVIDSGKVLHQFPGVPSRPDPGSVTELSRRSP